MPAHNTGFCRIFATEKTQDRSLFGSSNRVVVARTILDHNSIALSQQFEHILVAVGDFYFQGLAGIDVGSCTVHCRLVVRKVWGIGGYHLSYGLHAWIV